MLYRRLLALLMLAAFAVGLAQDLLRRGDDYVIHVVCPEHGEVMHASAPRPSSDRAVKALPASAHANGCELAVMGPTQPPCALPLALALPAMASLVLPASAQAPTLDRRDPRVIGYAPKTSPPVV